MNNSPYETSNKQQREAHAGAQQHAHATAQHRDAQHVLFDAASHLAAASAGLPPGISASLDLIGTKLVISYRIRIMVRGKRMSYGPFYNLQQAYDVWYSHKANAYGAMERQVQASVQSTSVQPSHLSRLSQSSQHQPSQQQHAAQHQPSSYFAPVYGAASTYGAANEANEANEHAAQQAQSEDAQSEQANSAASCEASATGGQLIAELYAIDEAILAAGVPPHELTGERMLTLTLPSGENFYLSAAMQREYNAWCVAGMPSQWPLAQSRSDNGKPNALNEASASASNVLNGNASAASASASGELSIDDL